MKKISYFLVLFLLLLTMSPLQASTKSDENEFFADLNVIASNNPEVIQAFTFYSTIVGILVINKYNYHAGSKKLGEVVQNPTWLSTPYDYTQPAACRILADRY